MQRGFTYTKQRLHFIVRDLLEQDVMAAPDYMTVGRAEEGFEKRATLEFLLWFLDQAFPENFSFRCDFEHLEAEYTAEIAKTIAEGKGWSSRQVREQESVGNVIFVDFKSTDAPDD